MNDLEARLLDAVRDIIDGSDYAPPDDNAPSMISEMSVIIGWTDADGVYSASHVRIGSPWATYGLVVDALDRMRQKMEWENAPPED